MYGTRTIRRLVLIASVAASIPVAILAFQATLRAEDNFHEVLRGEFYRAAQLSPESLADRVQRYKIRTIINLRGTQPDAEWYREESQVARLTDAKLIDFPMSATRQMTRDQAMKLVTLMKDAPKPILVHCKTGADRTGLVSVIYANQVAGIDEEEAEQQLTPFYGHFGIPFLSPTFAMDQSWEDFEQMFGIEGS